MKYTLRFVAVACLTFSLVSCDNVMDVQPLDQISESALWEDGALMEAYVNDIYRGIEHGYLAVRLSSGVDETKHTHGWDDAPVRQSILTPDNLGFFRTSWANWFPHYRWDDLYKRIRDTNVFLEKVENANADAALKNRLKGEVLFLRGYFYHNLMKLYGGVPLVTESYGLNDDFKVARASFEETINQIVSDLDAAAGLLPLVQSQDGRATKGAALALKARILLYAASDLYARHPSGMPETGYTGGSQQDRWRAAKAAAQAVMDLGVYQLYKGEPAPGDSTAKNYADIFLTPGNSEIILARHFLRTYPVEWFEGNIGLFTGPNGYHNWGGDTPTQQQVDAYEMADGSKFDWNNSVHAANPYTNRDPRFYASIFYNGAKWRERPADVVAMDPAGSVQTAYYEVAGQSELKPGLDTRHGPIEDWNGTYTGYYTRKFLDITVNHQFDRQEKPWLVMRYAEVLLNYAEASAALGEEDDARTAVNMVRRRAGMPDINDSGAALIERIRNERRVELAFEDHRYFDVRRWMIAPEAYEDGRGISITGRLNSDGTYHYEYEVVTVDERQWNDNAYFLPIDRAEMNRNDLLVQNPGYN